MTRRRRLLVTAGLGAFAVAALAVVAATGIDDAADDERAVPAPTTLGAVYARLPTGLPEGVALTTPGRASTTTTLARLAPATTRPRPISTSTTRPPTPRTAQPCPVFPADNPWNTDIASWPVHPQSATYINSIGIADHLHPDFGTYWDGGPIGIPYVHVGAGQPKVSVSFEYDDESDPGPYPIPPDAPIEGGASSDGDRHVIVVDDSACKLYELYAAYPLAADDGSTSWRAGSGAIFDLRSNALRPDGWTSADAAGLPIYAGLVRYDEVVLRGRIPHALRFTVSQTQRGYIHPATHFASDSTNPALPPMGLRLRMKQGYSCAAYSQEVRVICTALKTYGMLVADNGSDWYVSGAHDPRWNDDALGDLKQIPGSAFEVVQTGAVRT